MAGAQWPCSCPGGLGVLPPSFLCLHQGCPRKWGGSPASLAEFTFPVLRVEVLRCSLLLQVPWLCKRQRWDSPVVAGPGGRRPSASHRPRPGITSWRRGKRFCRKVHSSLQSPSVLSETSQTSPAPVPVAVSPVVSTDCSKTRSRRWAAAAGSAGEGPRDPPGPPGTCSTALPVPGPVTSALVFCPTAWSRKGARPSLLLRSPPPAQLRAGSRGAPRSARQAPCAAALPAAQPQAQPPPAAGRRERESAERLQGTYGNASPSWKFWIWVRFDPVFITETHTCKSAFLNGDFDCLEVSGLVRRGSCFLP